MTSKANVVIDNLGGKCPVQAEGTVNGHPFYFRAYRTRACAENCGQTKPGGETMKYRIRALWNQFSTEAIPAAAPDIQRKEMRRAFYAGVECALNRLSSEMSDGDSLDDPNDERLMKEVQRELLDFVEDMMGGRA